MPREVGRERGVRHLGQGRPCAHHKTERGVIRWQGRKESQTGASVEAHILVHAPHVPMGGGGRALHVAALCVSALTLRKVGKWGHFGLEFISAGCERASEANPMR